MKINAKSSNKKVAAVAAALSATLAFSGALAYLTDHDTKVNEIAFQQVDGGSETGEEGLITLTEDLWESGDTEKGAAYARAGILPGETLTKDPTIKINDWLTQAKAAGKNTPDLNLFMRVLVPVADVTNDDVDNPIELFAHAANSGWVRLGTVGTQTIASGDTAGTYNVYRYAYAPAGTTAASAGSTLTRAGAGATVASLFDTVTYTSAATSTPAANQHIIVDAYAIQADNLKNDDESTVTVANVYQMASGDTVTTA